MKVMLKTGTHLRKDLRHSLQLLTLFDSICSDGGVQGARNFETIEIAE